MEEQLHELQQDQDLWLRKPEHISQNPHGKTQGDQVKSLGAVATDYQEPPGHSKKVAMRLSLLLEKSSGLLLANATGFML